MLSSFLMGLIGGQRAMTPLATVAVAAARGELPADNGAPRLLSHPLVAAGTVALAIAEMAGDKQKTAPDRIVPIGLAARLVTSAIAGAALAPKRRRLLGAAVGGGHGGDRLLSRLARPHRHHAALWPDRDRLRRRHGRARRCRRDHPQRRRDRITQRQLSAASTSSTATCAKAVKASATP